MNGPMQPTYYVRHPDNSYSVADPQPVSVVASAGTDRTWVEVEKAKADAYEAAAVICEEMSYPPEGQAEWHGTDNQWAAIKLEDAAKAIRERKAKVCQVTQASVARPTGTAR